MRKSVLSVIAALSVLLAAFASGCSSGGSKSSAPHAAADQRSVVQDSMEKSGAGDVKMNGTEDWAAESGETASSVSESARKVVKTAQLSIETLDYEKSTSDFENTVASYGGYIESSSVEGTRLGSSGSKRNASYTARVPADRLGEFLNSAGSVGTVVSRSTGGEDVTQSYYDTDTRLKSLKTEQARLLELMQKAEKIDDVLSIEQRLTDVQTQIEQLTGELKKMDSLVSLATVTVSISEVEAITEPAAEGFGGQIASVFHSSIQAFVQAARSVFLVLIAVLPFAAAAAVIVGIVLFVRKRKRGGKS